MTDDAVTDETPAPAGTPSALALWNALVQEKLDLVYSTMNADEEVHKEHPGLWQAAEAEVAREAARLRSPSAALRPR
jgi:hypothetical protein